MPAQTSSSPAAVDASSSSPPRRHIPGLNFLPTSSPMRHRQLDDLVNSNGFAASDSPPRKLSASISSTGSGAPSPRRRPRRGRGKKAGGGTEESTSGENQEKRQNQPQKEQRRKQQPKQKQQQQQQEQNSTITQFFPLSPDRFAKCNNHNNNNEDGHCANGDSNGEVVEGITRLDNGDSQQQQLPQQQQLQQPHSAPTPGKKKKRRRKKTAVAVVDESALDCPHHHGLKSPPGIQSSGKGGGGGGGRVGGGKGKISSASKLDDQNNQQSRQSQLTDFYQVRRSDRRPKSEKEKEEKEMIISRIKDGRTDGLRIEDIPLKGRGVFADKNFFKGDFVIEYDGDLISFEKAKERESSYSLTPEVGCYMYYFSFQNRKYCVDATSESGKLGRLINHSTKTPNLTTRLFPIGDRPHLIFVAARDIDAGEELMYDYGDRSKEAAEAHPWLKS